MTTTALTRPISNEMTTAQNVPAAFNAEAALKYLGLDPRDAKSQALVLTCQRYGMDPLLKHVVLIGVGNQANMYVTRDGLMHVAHASGLFDGIEVDQLDETESHYIAIATVYRKDMQRGFRFRGRYPKNGRMAAMHGPEMAEKVAECRALRRAFDVALCSREETWEDESPINVTPQQTQRNRLIPAAPAASSEAEKATRAASLAFANEAKRLGFDVLNEEGKVSRAKIAQLYASMMGCLPDNAIAQDWALATEELATNAAEQTPAPIAPVAVSPIADPDEDTSEPEGTDGLAMHAETAAAAYDPLEVEAAELFNDDPKPAAATAAKKNTRNTNSPAGML